MQASIHYHNQSLDLQLLKHWSKLCKSWFENQIRWQMSSSRALFPNSEQMDCYGIDVENVTITGFLPQKKLGRHRFWEPSAAVSVSKNENSQISTCKRIEHRVGKKCSFKNHYFFFEVMSCIYVYGCTYEYFSQIFLENNRIKKVQKTLLDKERGKQVIGFSENWQKSKYNVGSYFHFITSIFKLWLPNRPL